MGGVPLVSMTIFACTLVWCADAENLPASGLFRPPCGKVSDLACRNNNVVLHKLAKHTIGIHSDSVCSGLDAGNCRLAVLVNICPVLIHLRVVHIVLEVDAVLGKHDDGVLGVLRQVNLGLDLATLVARDIVGDVLRNRVVEGRIPLRIRILGGIGAQLENVGAFREVVEVVVLLFCNCVSLCLFHL